MRFSPEFDVSSRRLRPRTEDEVRLEPMLFGADPRFAMGHGGPITREFVEMLPGQDRWVIDSKVVMLFPGMWPCIPGWHHDDVPRTRSDGQPNYDDKDNRSTHVMAIVGDCSRTEFLAQEVDVPDVPLGEKIYKVWDQHINALGALKTRFIEDGEIVVFNCQAFHRGTAATEAGWRFFIRASTKTTRPIRNEIRRQVQVYMADPSEGW